MKTPSSLWRVLSAIGTVIALATLPAHAAEKTWDGGGGADGTFALDDNWDTTAPANSITTDQALFSGEFSLYPAQPNVTANRSINRVNFGDTTIGGWNIGGAGTLTIGSGGISSGATVAHTGINTFSANLALGANQTWRAFNTGVLTVDGNVSGNYRITVGSGAASGPTGTVILTGANTHNGTAVGSGTLRVIDTTMNTGNTTVAKNGLGSGGVTIANDYGNNTGNVAKLEILVNGENNSSAQVLTYGNALRLGTTTEYIDVRRASGTGTNKIVAFGNVSTTSPGTTLTVTGDNGYQLSLGTFFVSGTTTDTGGFTLNPTGANIILAGVGNTASQARSPSIILGGTTANNVVTGNIGDRASGAAVVTNLSKSNTSTWELQAASTYTGSTTVTGGTLRLDSDATLGFGGMTFLGKGAGTTTIGNGTSTTATLDLNGAAALSEPITLNNGTLTNTNAATATIGNGVAVVRPTTAGTGYSVVPTVVFTGGDGSGAAATAQLGIQVSNITIDNGGSGYSTAPTVTISGGSGFGAIFNATITGNAVTAVGMQAPGYGYLPGETVTIAFSGGGGTGATATVSTAELGVTGMTMTSAGSGYTSAPAVSFTGAGTGGAVAGITMSSVTLSGSNTTISGAGNITIDAIVSGSGSFIKSGNNTLTLTGANIYTGKTTVNAGTVIVNGSHIEASAVTGNGYNSATNGHYLVADGGTLGGSGRIRGNNTQTNSNMIYVQSGGLIEPGASIGTLTLDGGALTAASSRVLSLATGAELLFELAGDGSAADRIDLWNYVTTDLALNDNKLNLALRGAAVAGTYEADIFRFYSDGGSSATASGIAAGLTLDGASIDPYISSASIEYNTNSISVIYTVIPEPSSALLLAVGALALLRRRRS